MSNAAGLCTFLRQRCERNTAVGGLLMYTIQLHIRICIISVTTVEQMTTIAYDLCLLAKCLLYNLCTRRCGGQQLASASFDGEIILWGGDTGKPRIRLHPALQEVPYACRHCTTLHCTALHCTALHTCLSRIRLHPALQEVPTLHCNACMYACRHCSLHTI
jgi:hypothetical protein